MCHLTEGRDTFALGFTSGSSSGSSGIAIHSTSRPSGPNTMCMSSAGEARASSCGERALAFDINPVLSCSGDATNDPLNVPAIDDRSVTSRAPERGVRAEEGVASERRVSVCAGLRLEKESKQTTQTMHSLVTSCQTNPTDESGLESKKRLQRLEPTQLETRVEVVWSVAATVDAGEGGVARSGGGEEVERK